MFVLCSDIPGGSVADDLIRRGLASHFDPDLAEARVLRLCPACGSSVHGRPLVEPIAGFALPWVSITRAAGLTVVALSLAGPVGVDVERRDSASFSGFTSVALHPAERAGGPSGQTVTWVRKESLVKAVGWGLRLDPTGVRLSDPGTSPPQLLEWPVADTPPSSVQLYDVDIDSDHVAAVAVLADVRPDLVLSPRATPDPGGHSRATTRRTVR